MSHSSQTVPTVTANIAGTKQQVNLRDYLNQRVAPFLKKAIHESLETEAEFPLQWLGEHLIQQSILYEGNPDRTNIRERFQYKHDIPSTTTPTTTKESVSTSAVNADNTTVISSSSAVNGNEEARNTVISSPGAEGTARTNAIANEIGEGQEEEEGLKTEEVSRDTEMGGTT